MNTKTFLQLQTNTPPHTHSHTESSVAGPDTSPTEPLPVPKPRPLSGTQAAPEQLVLTRGVQDFVLGCREQQTVAIRGIGKSLGWVGLISKWLRVEPGKRTREMRRAAVSLGWKCGTGRSRELCLVEPIYLISCNKHVFWLWFVFLTSHMAPDFVDASRSQKRAKAELSRAHAGGRNLPLGEALRTNFCRDEGEKWNKRGVSSRQLCHD